MRYFSITVMHSLDANAELTFIQETHPSRTEIRARLKELNGVEVNICLLNIHEFKSEADYVAYSR